MNKPSRIVDQKLLKKVREKKCRACGTVPSQAHHVTTVGRRGDDVPENVMPLCAKHHMLWHSQGPIFMYENFPYVRSWLEHHGRLDVIEKALARKGLS